MDAIFWGGILRFVEALTESAPTILVGLVIAGIFRRLVGPEGTRRLFGHGTRWALPRAWAIGMLLPVCSLGVIPVVRELRRDGLSGGTILAFALTAPLFNPLSVLYGLSLSEPLVIFTFALASLLIVTSVGVAFDRFFPNNAFTETAPPPVSYGPKRMIALVVAAVRELTGPTSLYILIGLLGVVLLNVVLPSGSLGDRMEQNNPTAALEMTLVALPAYATPMLAMSQLGSMFQHGNSISAAFVLLTFGAGANLGLLAWVCTNFGLRRSVPWFVGLVVLVVGLAYAMENPLRNQSVESAGHTHAFDIYCCPFGPGSASWSKVRNEITEQVLPHEQKAIGVLFGVGVLGVGLRFVDRRWRIEDWLERPDKPTEPARTPSRYDIVIPGSVLGGIALVGLIAFSVLACYTYYPPADQIFEDLRIIKAEVLSAAKSGDVEHAEYFIPLYQDWIRRLQVSVYLREGKLTPYRRMKARVLLDKIEAIKHAIEDGDTEEVERYFGEIDKAHRRLKESILNTPSTSKPRN